MDIRTTGSHVATRFIAYEAPCIESVLSSDEMEREVFYDGSGGIISGCGGDKNPKHVFPTDNGNGNGGCNSGGGVGGGKP